MTTSEQTALAVIETFYEGNLVLFRRRADGGLEANLSQMGKATIVTKRPSTWLRGSAIKQYIAALATRRNVQICTLLATTKGQGPESGTWADEEIAYRYAIDLSADFAIWVTGTIKQLRTDGVVTLYGEPVHPTTFVEHKVLRGIDRLDQRLDALDAKLEREIIRHREQRERAETFWWTFQCWFSIVREIVGRIPQNHDAVTRPLTQVGAAVEQMTGDVHELLKRQRANDRRVAESIERQRRRTGRVPLRQQAIIVERLVYNMLGLGQQDFPFTA